MNDSHEHSQIDYTKEAMHEHTRLHLETIKDDDYINSLLEGYFAHKDDGGDRVFYDYHVKELIVGAITECISKIK